jgi:5'-deoxynucleotidase YfbR-like HD superfamily hydrolase
MLFSDQPSKAEDPDLLRTTEPYVTGAAPYIHTFSGGKMFLLQPTRDMVKITDIAHALAHQARWTGHTRGFYSIAQHSVYVSQQLSPALRLRGLLHDASEAYTGDLNKPLKSVIGEKFAAIEDELTGVINKKYGLDPPTPNETEAVKQADLSVALAEAFQLLGQKMYHGGVSPARISIEYWDPAEAEETFLKNFKELM